MSAAEQLTLTDYVEEREHERQEAERAREHRRGRRTFIVFATDPERTGQEDYKLVFACEARTKAEAEGKIRGVVGEHRRVLAYLASGKYGNQLPEARWVK